jgi:hypothetical protein
MSTSAQPLSQYALFGRKYSITVALPSSDGTGANLITLASDSFEPEALRVTFDIYKPAFQVFWYADICIYNLDQDLTKQIVNAAAPTGNNSQNTSATQITQRVICEVQAGYQNGNHGTIWKGPVFQPLWERENAVDFKLTLRCMIGPDPLTRNFISGAFAAGMNQTDFLNRIINLTSTSDYPVAPVSGKSISSNLSPNSLFRGVTAFGNTGDYLQQIADSNNKQFWMSENGLNLGSPDEDVAVSAAAPLVFTPPPLPGLNSSAPAIPTKNQGIIIGTPQQTQLGVDFRALLNPQIKIEKPLMQVKIDNSQLRLQKKQIGQYPGLLDQDGTYIVGGARFVGDTRGTEWYVDITGYTIVGNALALFQAAQAGTGVTQQPSYNR